MKALGAQALAVALVFFTAELRAETQADLAEIDEISSELLTSMTCEVVIQAENAKRPSEKSSPEDLRHSVIDTLAFVYLQGYFAGITNSDDSSSERYKYLMEQHCTLDLTERFSFEGKKDGQD